MEKHRHNLCLKIRWQLCEETYHGVVGYGETEQEAFEAAKKEADLAFMQLGGKTMEIILPEQFLMLDPHDQAQVRADWAEKEMPF